MTEMTPGPEEYCVRLIDLPYGVNGMVSFDVDGFANIYINAHLTYEERAKAVRHELRHIANGDTYNALDIRNIEGFTT